MCENLVAMLIHREKNKKYFCLIEYGFFDFQEKFGVGSLACLLEDKCIKRKEDIDTSIVIGLFIRRGKCFDPCQEDEMQEEDCIQEVEIIFGWIFIENIFDIKPSYQAHTIGNIRWRKKSIAVETRSRTVTIIHIDIFSFDRNIFSKSYFKFKRIHRHIKEIELIIFYNFSIDDRKKFFRRNKRNKHTCRIDGLSYNIIGE